MMRGAGEDTASAAFVVSMPPCYAQVYSSAEMDEHAAIAARRGNRAAHAERWRPLPAGGAVVCVVADDSPGLLSLVSAALHLHELDVTTAQIYSRLRPDGIREAFDIFWLRALGAHDQRAIQDDEVASMTHLLAELVVRKACPDPIFSQRPARDALEPLPLARVFFEAPSLRQGKYVLVVEAFDQPGLLLQLARALHGQRLDIVTSDVRTEGNRVRDRFTVRDAEGQSLYPARLAAIRAAVLEAIRSGGS